MLQFKARHGLPNFHRELPACALPRTAPIVSIHHPAGFLKLLSLRSNGRAALDKCGRERDSLVSLESLSIEKGRCYESIEARFYEAN